MITDLFPIKIYKNNIKEDIGDELNSNMKLLLNDNFNQMKSDGNFWAESPTLESTRLMGPRFNNELFSNKTFDKLKKVIIEKCTEYVKEAFDYTIDEYRIQMWANKYGDNSAIFLHNHHGHHKKISGSYYMIKEEGAPDIIFSNPVKNLYRYGIDRDVNEIEIPLNEGDIIMFPSWMEHRAMANINNKKRMVIVFDVKLGDKK